MPDERRAGCSCRFARRGVSRTYRAPAGCHCRLAFHEGFALQSLRSQVLEQVAAVAEDLLRAGTRITGDMDMGDLSQVILETLAGKLIIAPYRDLSVCVLAGPDANLGLIRLSIRSMPGRDDP